MLFTANKNANRFPLSVSTIEYDENQLRKVFDLNGREVNENQVKEGCCYCKTRQKDLSMRLLGSSSRDLIRYYPVPTMWGAD